MRDSRPGTLRTTAMAVGAILALSLFATLRASLAQAAPDAHPAPANSARARAPLDLAAALDAGWQEAVLSVGDAAPVLRFLTEVAGWQLRFSSPLSGPVLDFYSGHPGSWPTAPGRREWLVTDAEGKPGFVRLVAFDRPEAVRIRSGAMPWDTGGVLSLMTRSNATDAVYRAAQRLGWSSFNDPTLLDMRDSGVQLTNVVLTGPDGIAVSIYERIDPRMPEAPDLRRLRRPFNAMQSVRDLAAARHFYAEVLGFEVVNEGRFSNPRHEPNNFGLPANLVAAAPLPFAILGPRRSGPTQIELVQFAGVEGRDLAARAIAPNLGVLALRFPVSRLVEVENRLRKARWPIAAGPAILELRPYGRVRLLAVRAPDGAWLEFFESVNP